MNFNTPPLAQIAPFDARFTSQTRKKARLCQLKAINSSFRVSKRSPWLMYHNSLGLKQRLLSLSVILARQWALDWALKVVRQIGRSVRIHKISYCLLLLHCSLLLRCPCFAHCCHDSVHREKCLKLFHLPLVSLGLCIRLGVHDQHWQLSVPVPVPVPVSVLVSPILHRVSVNVPRLSVHISGPLCASGAAIFHQIHHKLRQPSSCSGVWDPWSCRIQSRNLNNIVVQKQ